MARVAELGAVKAAKPDFSQQERDRELTKANVIHQADIALRALIHSTVSLQPQSRKSEIAKLLNEIRKDVLDQFKQSSIKVSHEDVISTFVLSVNRQHPLLRLKFESES
eukprot:c8820_g1_i3.p2 GENE.c8820_g1_i3~~c8820_g1_i3.p2  ORF type:complete len:109 (-),score=22.83 c8820_g1_i3:47-373(-)